MDEYYDKAVGLWQRYNLKTEADLDRVLHNFRILFAYHSGKIENDSVTFYDTREIFVNDRVLGFTGNPRSLLEQLNQKMCYEYLKKKILTKQPVTIELVKELHEILTSGTYDERRYITNEERPGEFKKHDYVTGIYEVGSPADRVESDLKELLEEVNEYAGDQILRVGTYFHVRFEDIHPFADGNGRVGRTLLNYYLIIHGHPPLIVFDEDKNFYYECLLQYDEKEDIDPLHKFFIYETEKTWKRAVDLADGKTQGRKGLAEQI